MNKTKIVFIASQPFPSGLAASNRILSLAKGLVKNSAEVRVLTNVPVKNKNFKNSFTRSGIINGISFYNYSPLIKWSKMRLFNFLSFIAASILILLKFIIRKEKANYIIVSYLNPLNILFYYTISKVSNAKLIFMRSEYPAKLIKKATLKSWHHQIEILNLCKLYHGMLIMTNNLANYFQKYKRKSIDIHISPMTVDIERFGKKNIIKPKYIEFPEKYILYVGSLNFQKDGVDVLVKAFSRIVDSFKDLRLVIVGNATAHQIDELKRIDSHLFLKNQVLFTGHIDSKCIPYIMTMAELLVLPRPESLQAQGGFPTKLGEYLCSGKPVIATRVGEIPHYLTDGVNSFLVDPGNVLQLENKIKHVLSEPIEAERVGIEGKNAAISHFNNVTVAKNILQYLLHLIK